MRDKLPELTDDGLITPEIGAWGEDKYRLVGTYAALFATSMKKKWECRVYIDLFAGSGRARIENTKRIIPASPILALDIKDRFDVYIFCEEDKSKMKALQKRVSTNFPDADCRFLHGDSNQLTAEILKEIPSPGRNFKVLSFCFVDPYKLGNLSFETIRLLASLFVDFLILIPTYMDANRNLTRYLEPQNETVEQFLGMPDWRREWERVKLTGESLAIFILDQFGRRMADLDYLHLGKQEAILVRSTEKNLPLYHLAFFSRKKLGQQFWKEAKKYSQDQMGLPFEESRGTIEPDGNG